MVSEMMKQCCGDDGMPDFKKMKQFMEQCGKEEFSEEHMAMMKEFCAGKGVPDFEKMKGMMEECGCRIPESKVSL